MDKFKNLNQNLQSWECLIELKLSEIVSGVLVASLLVYVDISRRAQFSNARKYLQSKNDYRQVQSGNI